MFRHQGKRRTYKHNLSIASLLSFVAGIVNVAGFFSVQKLTTNVTGHFAFFMEELFKFHVWEGFVFFLYIFFFFLGSFLSNLIVELTVKKNETAIYTLPIFIESLILISVAFSGNYLIHQNPNALAFSLLFAMGVQNSLVTSISNATVRTTHLTGLFTDLGIETSQLFFYKKTDQRKKLKSSIKLRLTIIFSFFVGGVIGALLYTHLQLHVLTLAATCLFIGLRLDHLKMRYKRIKRQLSS